MNNKMKEFISTKCDNTCKDNLPLVSIGLPTYNRPASLRRTLESAIQQSYPRLEIIISDNASPDPEVEHVVRHFMLQDARIQYFRQEKNEGPNFNFSFVLKQATGEYFMWLGDDDWLDPTYIERCVRELIKHPKHALVCGKAQYFLDGTFAYQGIIVNLLENSGQKRVLEYYRKVSDNGTVYGVMRREQVRQIPIRRVIGADWLFMSSVAFTGTIKTLETISVNRVTRSFDRHTYFQNLALQLGVSKFQAQHPHLSTAVGNFLDIAFCSPIYKQLNRVERLCLAYKSSVIIIERFVGFPYPVTLMFRVKKKGLSLLKKYYHSLKHSSS